MLNKLIFPTWIEVITKHFFQTKEQNWITETETFLYFSTNVFLWLISSTLFFKLSLNFWFFFFCGSMSKRLRNLYLVNLRLYLNRFMDFNDYFKLVNNVTKENWLNQKSRLNFQIYLNNNATNHGSARATTFLGQTSPGSKGLVIGSTNSL